jgi:gliding motility-associated-like protein
VASFIKSSNVCLGLPITFTDQSAWAKQWLWNFGDSAISTDENPPAHIYPYAGIFHVQLIVTGDGGTDVLSQDVEVYPVPKAQFTPVPSVVELSGLYPVTPAQVQFSDNSQLAVKYLWNFGDSTTSVEKEPNHNYTTLGYKTVDLSVWSVFNCFDSLVMINAVDVIGGGVLTFPNVFVPSSAGSNGGKFDPSAPPADNSVFRPVLKDVLEYNLEIYDRWGEKLFQTNDVTIGWDGYYKGSLCKGDVYVWIAKGKFTNGQTFNMAGTVTLIK